MPKMIMTLDGVVLQEVRLTKDRTTLGRRPYNDIVIDNLAVSGEHAVLQMSGSEGYIEDLNSTNGTYVNGKVVKKLLLKNNDIVEIAKYKIQYVSEAQQPDSAQSAPSIGLLNAAIRVLSGAAAGREMPLVKEVTRLGKPQVAVAAINKSPRGFEIVQLEGRDQLTINGAAAGRQTVALKDGDMIELAGAQLQFVLL